VARHLIVDFSPDRYLGKDQVREGRQLRRGDAPDRQEMRQP
jgi:hypothetical protein